MLMKNRYYRYMSINFMEQAGSFACSMLFYNSINGDDTLDCTTVVRCYSLPNILRITSRLVIKCYPVIDER